MDVHVWPIICQTHVGSMAGPWLGSAGHSWTMAGHDCTWLDLTCLLPLLATAGPVWPWLALAGHTLTGLDVAGLGWLTIAG